MLFFARKAVLLSFFILCCVSAFSSAFAQTDPNPAFSWSESRKLVWNDFEGPVDNSNLRSAAATHCGIGYKLSANKNSGKQETVIYNVFYPKKSWVRDDARLPSILIHEQGHFDLAELYTRKIRATMNEFNAAMGATPATVDSIFNEVENTYEIAQQNYETETAHGTITDQQKKWTVFIASELAAGATDNVR